MDGLRIRAQSEPWNRGVEFLAVLLTEGMRKKYGQPLTLIERNEVMTAEPTFTLSMESAQLLMDDLWNCGLRPTEGTGSAGALFATQKHLEDMRTLVFKPGRSNNAE